MTRTDVAAAVRSHGGVAHTSELHREAISKYHQAAAVASGAVTRIRRSFLAVPDADAMLVAAARAGVVLTCTTQARRLGLWVIDDGVVHVAANGRRVGARGAHVHWVKPLVPRHPTVLVDPIENVLAVIASCRPRDEALAVWESAVKKGLVSLEQLSELPFGARARAILADTTPWSDSGLESFVPPRLKWLRLAIVPQAWLLGHRVDFLIGDRLVLQIDGAHHVGAQRDADIAHDAALMLAGYHVIRVGYAQVVHSWPAVQELVMRAVARGLHRGR